MHTLVVFLSTALLHFHSFFLYDKIQDKRKKVQLPLLKMRVDQYHPIGGTIKQDLVITYKSRFHIQLVATKSESMYVSVLLHQKFKLRTNAGTLGLAHTYTCTCKMILTKTNVFKK